MNLFSQDSTLGSCKPQKCALHTAEERKYKHSVSMFPLMPPRLNLFCSLDTSHSAPSLFFPPELQHFHLSTTETFPLVSWNSSSVFFSPHLYLLLVLIPPQPEPKSVIANFLRHPLHPHCLSAHVSFLVTPSPFQHECKDPCHRGQAPDDGGESR